LIRKYFVKIANKSIYISIKIQTMTLEVLQIRPNRHYGIWEIAQRTGLVLSRFDQTYLIKAGLLDGFSTKL
jgi:hypothetical protein